MQLCAFNGMLTKENNKITVEFKGFEGQGLRARLCCRRYLTPYFGYIILPHVDWPAQCLAHRNSQKEIYKKKR